MNMEYLHWITMIRTNLPRGPTTIAHTAKQAGNKRSTTGFTYGGGTIAVSLYEIHSSASYP